MCFTINSKLEDYISPEAIALFAPAELDMLGQWLNALRESNLIKPYDNMICIPPQSKELKAAIKRVVAIIIKNRPYSSRGD